MSTNGTVSSKIIRPRFAWAQQRSDLLNLFDELRTAPLIMVSGLPGAGKTALVANYVETRNIPCIWYQVDQGDESLANFFHYLGIAAKEINPYKKADLPEPTAECISGNSASVKAYFQQLYRCLDTPFLMVFNNYQEISEGASLHQVIQIACTALPVGGRIILISSNDSPPTVACLRANGSTAIIGWQDLKLNPAKVKEMAALQGVTLPLADAAKQLQRKVGGWAADLVLGLQKSRD
jgi:LuxR family maltose regulon positive regulatory protein